jgi:signal transduction histidine kinase
LQQVMLNLISNALEAMAATTDRARSLRLKSEMGEPNDVLITVQDSGPGIDQEHMDRIFRPFFTTKSNGMGMGLSICRSIIEAHNGRLSASSGIDHGCVFRVALPIDDLKSQENRGSTSQRGSLTDVHPGGMSLHAGGVIASKADRVGP